MSGYSGPKPEAVKVDAATRPGHLSLLSDMNQCPPVAQSALFVYSVVNAPDDPYNQLRTGGLESRKPSLILTYRRLRFLPSRFATRFWPPHHYTWLGRRCYDSLYTIENRDTHRQPLAWKS